MKPIERSMAQREAKPSMESFDGGGPLAGQDQRPADPEDQAAFQRVLRGAVAEPREGPPSASPGRLPPGPASALPPSGRPEPAGLWAGNQGRGVAREADRDDRDDGRGGDSGRSAGGTLPPGLVHPQPVAPTQVGMPEPDRAGSLDQTQDRDLGKILHAMVSRLLVAQDGGPVVILELDERLLPQTRVRITEQDGRLTAAFVCADAPTRERLNGLAGRLARGLAGALGRSTLIQVGADDNGYGLVEVFGDRPE